MDIVTPFLRPLVQAVFGWLPGAHRWVTGRFGPWVPLHVAARIVYEQARLNRASLAYVAERGPDKSPAGILSYVAHYIALEVPIRGKRQPSTVTEVIDPRLAQTGTFADAGSLLRLRDGNNTVFTDLCVARKDLGHVLDLVRNGLKTDTPI